MIKAIRLRIGFWLLLIAFSITAYSQASIFAMEYYIDSDPGVGNGVSIPITQGVNQDVDININTGSLSVGFHELMVRARYSDGTWGIQETRVFYVSATSIASSTNLTELEYFFDVDPGFGNGTSMTLSPSQNIDMEALITTSSLSSGFHVLHMRVKDSDGTWGIQESRVFYVSATSIASSTNLTELEYFFDMDPGFGNGTSIAISPSQSIDMEALITTSSLPSGFHVLHVRVKDSEGAWSMHNSQAFYVDALTARGVNANLAGIEYFIDTDPGVSSASEIAIDPAVFSIDQEVMLPTSSLPNGSYSVGMRVFNVDGSYSLTETANFDICSGATVDFSASVVCAGTATDFTDLSTDTMTGDTYSWDFDNDGNEDDNTVGNTSFTYASAGIYTATLSIDRGGCEVSKELTVEVESIPDVNAGSDQNITSDNATLAASAVQVGETGTWSIVSGTGILTDANNPVTTISDLSIGETILRWTVVNDIASCSEFDELTIIRNSNLSVGTDILSFTLPEQSSPTEIDAIEHTVFLLAELGTDVTSLTPVITISDGASISPNGTRNFASSVIYTVTAEDGIATQDWLVTIQERPLGSSYQNEIEVYPNPASDELFIKGLRSKLNITFHDMIGRNFDLRIKDGRVSLMELPPGIFWIVIKDDESTVKRMKIIKKE
ncbi:T9SS type A sorting domain-containing protein [Ekhidna sp.]